MKNAWQEAQDYIKMLLNKGRGVVEKTRQSPVAQATRNYLATPLNTKQTKVYDSLQKVINAPITQIPRQFTSGMLSGSNLGMGGFAPAPKTFPQKAANFGGSIVGAMNPYSLTGRVVGPIVRATNPILAKTISPVANKFVTGRLASGVANVAQGAAINPVYGRKPLEGAALDFATGVAFGPNQFSKMIPKQSFTMDRRTSDELIKAGEMLKNPNKFIGVVNTGKRTQKEALVAIKDQANEIIERLSAKYLPDKQLTSLRTPTQKIKALVDLNSQNKLANIEGMGIVQKTEPSLMQPKLSKLKGQTNLVSPSQSLKTNASQTPVVPTLSDLTSTSILPQKGKLNVKNLNLGKRGQQLVRASNQVAPTVIGNKDVVKASKLTKGATTAMSDSQMKELLAKRLNSRQSVVSLTKEFNQLKKSGADEKTLLAKFSEIADQSRIAQQEGTLAGRQLQAQNILADQMATPQQRVLALLDNAGIDKKKYLKDAVNVNWDNGGEVVAFYRKYVPPKLGEVLTEIRYSNMLSSPLTHVINIATNAWQAGVVAPVEKTLTGGLDWVKSIATGSERQYYASDGIKYAKAYYKSFPEAWTKFKNVLSGKEMTIKPDMERLPTSTKGFLKAYTSPLRALEAADNFFMTMVKSGEEASMQGRGLTAKQIVSKAEDAARYRLFRQAFDPSGKTGQGYLLKTWDKYNSVIQQLRRLPGGNWIVPFLQTPTNILKQGVEYSPLGLGTIPGSKAPLEQLSKAIIGSTVFAGAYGLLNSTEFTWDTPKGQKERDLFYAANMQPYSIKIGDKWVSYSKLGPLSYPIAMAAALRYAEKYNISSDKESPLSTAVGGMMKFFSDQSYVKQLGDFIDSVQTGKGMIGGLKSEAANTVSQLVPYKSFLGWLSRIIDPYTRKADGVVGSITSQLPGLSMMSDTYYNPVTKGPSERSNRFLNAVSPVRLTTGDKTAEQLYKYTGSAKTAYANLKRLPKEEAAAIYVKIKKASPAIASGIVKLKKQEDAGMTPKENSLLNLSAGDGERAYTLNQEFSKLKTNQEKAALWDHYVKTGVITKDVAKQLKQLIKETQ